SIFLLYCSLSCNHAAERHCSWFSIKRLMKCISILPAFWLEILDFQKFLWLPNECHEPKCPLLLDFQRLKMMIIIYLLTPYKAVVFMRLLLLLSSRILFLPAREQVL